MITSYVTPQRSMLYLSLVGALDARGAEDLVKEYYERYSPTVRRCILDLADAEETTEAGLAVIHRLSLVAQVDGIEFSVVAGGSSSENDIQMAARRYWVPVLDARPQPMAAMRGTSY